ncbi:MAG: hypothetical protein ACPG5W_10055, partial [Flavobacteriales bacterium]
MKKLQTLTLLLVVPFLSFAQPGTLDNSFDADGIGIYDLFGNSDIAWDLAVQPDGKIVFTGTTSVVNSPRLYVARINPDGSFDNSFGNAGVVVPPNVNFSEGLAMAMQPDGKIVACGVVGGTNGLDFYVVRLNADGSMDTNFGVGGELVAELSPDSDQATDVLIQPDGKIIVLGQSWNGTNYDAALIRLNPDGSLDNTFSFDGIVKLDIAGSDDPVQMALGSDGKIAAINRASNAESVVFRLNADGTPDATFGNNGQEAYDLVATDDWLNGIFITEDDKMVVCGISNGDVIVARINWDGSLDNTFSFDGVVQSDFGEDEGAFRVLVQPDDKILVVGSLDDGERKLAMFRYNNDGTLDNTFGTNGLVTTAVAGRAVGLAVALEVDGKILVPGSAGDSQLTDAMIARYLSGINIGIGEVDAYIGST